MKNQDSKLFMYFLIGIFLLAGIASLFDAILAPKEVQNAKQIITETLPEYQKFCEYRELKASVIGYSKTNKSICINVYSKEYQKSNGILDAISKVEFSCGTSAINLQEDLDSRIYKKTAWDVVFSSQKSNCYY